MWATRCIDGKVDPEVLANVVQRVVDVASPEKVVLFGSAARDEMSPSSDLDLLVIKDTQNAHGLAADIHSNLWGVEAAVDVIVVTPEQVERYKNSHALVIKPALQEGRVVYNATREPSEGRHSAFPSAPKARRSQPVENAPYGTQEGRDAVLPRGRPDDPREWLKRARSNLALAANRIPGVYLEDLCFSAQQAAERALKALLLQRSINYPYVHDLALLVTLLENAGETVPSSVGEAGKLTPYATATTHPLEKVVTEREYQEGLAIARAVVRWVESKI